MRLEDQIPGYWETVAWEVRVREDAWFLPPRSLCGVDVVRLTLRRLGYLLSARSVFLGARSETLPESADAALFLWIVSPEFDLKNAEAQVAFFAKSKLAGAFDDHELLCHEIDEYLAETFNDAPAVQEEPGRGVSDEPPPYAFAASLIDTLAEAYGWTSDCIQDQPLQQLYQLLRRIARRKDPKTPFINRRSRKLKGNYLRSLRKQKPSETAP